MSSRERWFARMMEAGLEEKIFAPSDVLQHATPEVLAQHLPADLMSKVLQTSLSAGAMTPEGVLETVTPDLLARHLPHEVLWDCIRTAAHRAGLDGK
jgi:hypothetical protein